jgi:hypothetical protein
MAGVKISELPAADPTDGTEIVEIVQSGSNRQSPLTGLLNGFFYTTGTFTGTLGGVLETVTGTITWVKLGGTVFLSIPTMTGTSNSISLYLGGIPANLIPVSSIVYSGCPEGSYFYDGGGISPGPMAIQVTKVSSRIYFEKGSSWTIGGEKGFRSVGPGNINISYMLY